MVGIVQNLPFDAEPENAQGMIYLFDRYAGANLLIVRGVAQAAEIERLAAQLTRDFNIKIESSQNYQALLARNTQSYRSRAWLGLLAASISASICFFSLISVALLEFAQKRRSLALYAALGAALWRRYIFASAGVQHWHL